MFRCSRIRYFSSRVPTTRVPSKARNNPKKSYPFDKILVANRGEIAIRIMKTAKRLGLKTVAVYSDADRHSPHVEYADEAQYIGPALASQSYLNIDNIIYACKASKATALHPGYGFLSENSKFVNRLDNEGITFIGPEAEAMNKLGDKINSKKIAKQAGVNIIPGFIGEVPDADEAVKISREIGYPVMIKASAGGGGKGMRVARNDEEVRNFFVLAASEALSSFGDSRLLIEKFLEGPKHIEVQILGDKHGNVVAFPERDCSVQRRNQKVVEESPSSSLHPEIREAMMIQARALASAVKYSSAGTIEFMVDKKQNFYFLEMNTRLQVEHPITELITGHDLVEHMINVAAGFKLPPHMLRDVMVPYRGHAIECRVYAEDPKKNFVPSVGQITHFKPIDSDDGFRVDTGIKTGSMISRYYDPMIAKVCTFADEREKAIEMMEDGLAEFIVRGVRHNVAFCLDIMRNLRFRDGNISTKFIEQEYKDGFKGSKLTDKELSEVASTIFVWDYVKRLKEGDPHDMIYVPDGTFDPDNPDGEAANYGDEDEDEDLDPHDDTHYYVTLTGETGQKAVLKYKLMEYRSAEQIEAENEERIRQRQGSGEGQEEEEEDGDDEIDGGGAFSVAKLSDGSKVAIPQIEPGSPMLFTIINDVNVPIQYYGEGPKGYQVEYRGATFNVAVNRASVHSYLKHFKPKKQENMAKYVKSPMAGALLNLRVKPGDRVVAGQTVAIVEAMKMQNELLAEKDAIVKSVKCVAGDNISEGQVIIELEDVQAKLSEQKATSLDEK